MAISIPQQSSNVMIRRPKSSPADNGKLKEPVVGEVAIVTGVPSIE